jgi:hypothetical protein
MEGNMYPARQPKSGLVITGYVTAILLPLIGFILGIVVCTRPAPESQDGWKIIVASIVAWIVWIVIIVAIAAHSSTPTYPTY